MGRLAAVVLCAAAALSLAVSQAFVIYDAAAIRHPAWPAFALWSLALGVELAIVSAVLASALEGYTRPMVVVDAFLISLSVAIGYGLVSALGLVPVAYSAVIIAAHRLHNRYHKPAAPAPKRTRAAEPKRAEPARMPDDWRAKVEAGVVDHIETKAAAARAVGVHPSSFGRAFARGERGWVAA